MKKILSLFIIAGFAALVACGPSAEEKAAAEKARQDSINAAMAQMTADSLAKVSAAMEKAKQDSMAMVMHNDSLAKAEADSKKHEAKPKAKPAAQKPSPAGNPQVGHKKPGAK